MINYFLIALENDLQAVFRIYENSNDYNTVALRLMAAYANLFCNQAKKNTVGNELIIIMYELRKHGA